MASKRIASFVVFTIFANTVYSKEYILGDLNKCTRVPDEPPCHIPYDHFVPDYASRRYHKLMELIYRKAKDVARLDSRPKCVNAYRTFLCAQLFPRCAKYQNPRFSNLDMNRWVVHDPSIRAKCQNIFGSCNGLVANKFMSTDYFMCDYLSYIPEGWQSDRCEAYDLDTRCTTYHGKMPLWYLNYHDQNVVEYLNATRYRINHIIPYYCTERILNVLCRHPVCSEDGKYLVTNYTRQQCDGYLTCARFVPGEINVDAMCVLFPSIASSMTASMALLLITNLLHYFTSTLFYNLL